MKTKILGKALLLSVIALSLSSCSVKGNIEELGSMIKTSIFGQQAGLVSGSTQGSAAITSNGYKVSASVGHMTDSIQETANGYKVYSSIQGSTSADVSVTVPPM